MSESFCAHLLHRDRNREANDNFAPSCPPCVWGRGKPHEEQARMFLKGLERPGRLRAGSLGKSWAKA